jgi:hypothetical protein
MQRTTYRPWIQRTVIVLAMTAFLLIGVTMFTMDDMVARRDWFAIILYGLTIVFSVPGIWLGARLGVVVDERGVRFHNFGRGRFISWDQVTEVSCVTYDRGGPPLYVPEVQVRGEQTPLALTVLGSYRQEAAQRHTEAIRSRLV